MPRRASSKKRCPDETEKVKKPKLSPLVIRTESEQSRSSDNRKSSVTF